MQIVLHIMKYKHTLSLLYFNAMQGIQSYTRETVTISSGFVTYKTMHSHVF